jgi:hypothetical protein
MTDTAAETENDYAEITLRVKRKYAEEKDPGYELFMSIQDAVRWGNPAGQHLSDTATRSIVEAIMTTLGIDAWERRMPKTPPVVDPMRGVRQAVRDLLTFVPEGGYPEELGAIGFAHDNVGFFSTAEDYQAYLDGKGGKRRRDAAPFFADPVLYAVLRSGKHDGRSLKGHIRSLMSAVGLTEADTEKEDEG